MDSETFAAIGFRLPGWSLPVRPARPMVIVHAMRAALLLALSLAFAAEAHQRRRAFHVGAVVTRSCRIHVDASGVQLGSGPAAVIAIDSSPPRLASAAVPLPPGTRRVTIQY